VKNNRIFAKPWFRTAAVSLVLGAVFLAVILNLPASAELPEPTPFADSWQSPASGAEPVHIRLENLRRLLQAAPVGVSLAANGWTNIMTEDFDGTWPAPGWTVFDNDGMTNGEYYWGPTSCFDYGASGDQDAVPHSDGASAMYTCWQPYPTNLNSWMVYGHFDLSTATDAELLFDLYLDSELDHDYFIYATSINGTDFFGYQESGDTDGWVTRNFDLTDVPTLGDLTGQSQVWIAFIFQSDSHEDTIHAGPWLDDIVLRASVGGCPGASETSYIQKTDNENNQHTGYADGDMYPANPDCIYNNHDKPNCPELKNPLAPIEFNIVVDPLPSPITSAALNIYAWDVDEEGDPQHPDRPVERDEVYFNGHFVGTLTGWNQTWSTSHFSIDTSWVQQGNNLVEVLIDKYDGCWCVSIDWGQLVLGGGGGAASIYSAAPDRTCYQPGWPLYLQMILHTTLQSQEVRIEVNLIDPYNITRDSWVDTRTIYGPGTNNDVVANLTIPADAPTGDYTIQIFIYDTCSETQNDYLGIPIRVDEACGTVTPTVTRMVTRTPTPTMTSTPTPTPTSTPDLVLLRPAGSGQLPVVVRFQDGTQPGAPASDQRQL